MQVKTFFFKKDDPASLEDFEAALKKFLEGLKQRAESERKIVQPFIFQIASCGDFVYDILIYDLVDIPGRIAKV